MTERFEPYEIVPEQKIKETRDPRQSNAVTFMIRKEDHTIGHMLRTQLLKDKNVLYAAYRHPHPLENYINIYVQTDGTVEPRHAFNRAITTITADLDRLSNSFEASLSGK